ncbi:hypothetical protein SPONN_2525 [uncultured Candidatus Thioglobus sp.]|nr:hypothetical protein SPONN_2525 [uncultured Candidatus Thioglobus sp.]
MNAELIFSAVETLGIVAALVYTAKQNFALRKEMKLQAYNATIDRIYQIRTLLINDPDLYKVWDGGIEGKVLETVNHKHFYLIKMILHMNESLYIKIKKEESNDKNHDLLAPFLENLRTDLTATQFREVWKNNRIVRESYDDDFQKEVNKIIQEIEAGHIKEN